MGSHIGIARIIQVWILVNCALRKLKDIVGANISLESMTDEDRTDTDQNVVWLNLLNKDCAYKASRTKTE